MKKRTLQSLLVLVLAVAALAGAFLLFNSRKSDAYMQVVPKDARVVGRMDLKALMKSVELDAEEVSSALQLRSADEVAHLGIDLTRPFVGFLARGDYMGFAACVSNDAELTETCRKWQAKGVCGEVKTQRGYSWAVVAEQWLLAFNTKKALLMGPAVGESQTQLMGDMFRYLEQKEEESGVEMPIFKALQDMDAPMAMAANSRAMSSFGGDALREKLGVIEADDLIMKLGLNISPKSMELEAELEAGTEKVEKAIETLSEGFGKIGGALAAQTSRGSIAWACANIDGEKVLGLMRSGETLRTLLLMMNLAVDVDMIIKAVHGDVAIELNSQEDYRLGQIPAMRLTAELENTDFLKNADYWIESARERGGVQLVADSPNDFCLSYAGTEAWFGTKDKLLYVTNDRSMITPTGKGWIEANSKEIKGKRLYVTLDVQGAKRSLASFMDIVGDMPLERLTLEADDIDEWKLTITGDVKKLLTIEH